MYPLEQALDDQIIRSVDSISMLFWNHSAADIQYLRESCSNINYVWGAYIDSADHTYMALWKAWIDKFTIDSKRIIAEYAIKKFSNAEGSLLDN